MYTQTWHNGSVAKPRQRAVPVTSDLATLPDKTGRNDPTHISVRLTFTAAERYWQVRDAGIRYNLSGAVSSRVIQNCARLLGLGQVSADQDATQLDRIEHMVTELHLREPVRQHLPGRAGTADWAKAVAVVGLAAFLVKSTAA
jgi:hypothetical protein